MSLDSQSSRPLPAWRFWLPLLFQASLILVVPAQALYTAWTGRAIALQTVPVDPYDWLRGYSQALRYDISRRETLQRLPGWEKLEPQLSSGDRFYVILQAPPSPPSHRKRPQAWQAIAVSRDRRANLPANQVTLQANYQAGSINYGLETYYLPEDQRHQINAEINQTLQGASRERPFVVEVKVDRWGKAIPVSLWIGDRNYRF
jgi:uncharacterized membrane-anchored protein